jgi:hypothetical protein
MVEERLFLHRRVAVAAERIEPTPPILQALGRRPDDPAKARAWAEGVDLIHGFRLRWGVEDSELEALASSSNDRQRRQERERAARQVREVQRTLEVEGPLELVAPVGPPDLER